VRLWLLPLCGCVVVAGCSSEAPLPNAVDVVQSPSSVPSSNPDPQTSITPAATAAPVTDTPTTTPALVDDTPSARAERLCEREGVVTLGRVQNDELTEASGLVSSRTYPGVLWSHNDGGSGAGVFGIGEGGGDIGFHPLPDVGPIDVEDIAIAAGATGDDLFVADIGDNRLERPSIRVYRFPEPAPERPGLIAAVEVLEFAFPKGPHNSETFLVDAATNRVVIVTKEQQLDDGMPDNFGKTLPSLVFEGAVDGHGAGPVELVNVGTIDMPALEAMNESAGLSPASLLGFGGVPTSGDVSADGSLVALRTYEAVWLWARQEDQSVAEALLGTPCQVTVASERQGEALAFVDDGLVTLSEGVNQPLNGLAR
jgi:hypothetical protein